MIDAGVDGNDARFINHSCDPNCETVIEGGRVFIEALRTIQPGEELGYEYGLTWESTDDPDELASYACRCGAAKCRGTMLDAEPLDKKPARKQAPRRRRRRPAAQDAAEARAPVTPLSIIVAADERGGIGRDGGLPWHLPADLKRFKALTMGKPIVMGRRTWDSIGRPLPGRRSIVVSRQAGLAHRGRRGGGLARGQALRAAADAPEICVIGGAELYRLGPAAGRCRPPHARARHGRGGHLPAGARSRRTGRRSSRERHAADERHAYPYSFVTLRRIRAPASA